MPIMAAAAVLLLGIGVMLIVAGWTGTPISENGPSRRSLQLSRQSRRRLIISVVAGLVSWVATGWPALLIVVGGVTYMLQGLFVDREGRGKARDRLRAVATWLEMLRDTVASGSGIARAVVVTSDRAPRAISVEVRRLAVRLDSMRLEDALWQFGADLDVPAADTAIAALVLATREQGSNLTRLLSTVIASTRKRVEQDDRVDAYRAKFATSAVMMVVVTTVSSLIIIGGSAQFRSTYDTLLGQVVLVAAGGVFILAIWVLRWMGRPSEGTRLVGARL